MTSTESKSGKSMIILGLMQALLKRSRQVTIFRPIIDIPAGVESRDHDINLVLEYFGLDIPYEDTYAYNIDTAREFINSGRQARLMENIFEKFKSLESKYDFIFCEGTDLSNKDSTVEFNLNLEIASTLGCPVILVVNAWQKSAGDMLDISRRTMDIISGRGLELLSCLINRAAFPERERSELAGRLRSGSADSQMIVCVLPEEPTLGCPSMADVRKWFDARVLYGEKRLDNLVSSYLVAAMQVEHFMEYLTPGCMIIVPGDREDILLACLSSRLSTAFPEVAGIVLTGDLSPHSSIRRLLDNMIGEPIPILGVEGHTFKTIQTFTQLYGRIDAGDTRKINTALGYFERYVEGDEIVKRVLDYKTSKMTPKMFEYNLLEKARSKKMRIVLPEGQDERILQAADIILRREVADLIILGDPAKIHLEARNKGLSLENAVIIDPVSSPLLEDYVYTYHELRKHKAMPLDQARDLMLDPTYFGTMMVYKDDADGMVSGAANTTAHTVRPAFEIIRTRTPGTTVSSIFLMCLKDRVLVFGDCAINPNPTPQELARIAVDAAETAVVFGIEPRVAMLSYSTGDSGSGADVDKVKEATLLAKQMAPDLLLEGPLQYDAAIDPAVAAAKMPENTVAGRATVFIFPDLNTGNNTYKAVQRAADAVAIGPVLQGLKKPVNDLSRGAKVTDIVNTVAITAVQAQSAR
jgi:phosphate acetyltransferase